MINKQGHSNQLDAKIQKAIKLITTAKDKKKHQDQTQRFLIGICGIPGSGKTTICQKLSKHLDHSVILPMDGFHIRRQLLTNEGIIRRGAAFTFDFNKFQQKIMTIRKSKVGNMLKYPSFDHKQKDPVEDEIEISSSASTIMIQGLYVFHRTLKLNNQPTHPVWDFKIWIDSGIETAVERVAKRHHESGIEPTYQLAHQRATTNDRSNSRDVVENCFNGEVFKDVDDANADIAIIIQNSQNIYNNI